MGKQLILGKAKSSSKPLLISISQENETRGKHLLLFSKYKKTSYKSRFPVRLNTKISFISG
jgi:hypothetical protein